MSVRADSLTFAQVTGTVPTPPAGTGYVYAKTDHSIGVKLDTGAEGQVYPSTSLPPVAQEFRANGTWTKPVGARFVEVLVVGGGGGGQGGGASVSTSSIFTSGGAGGDGGLVSRGFFRAEDLPATVPITIGAGGTGGAGESLDGTVAAANGVGGGTSYFGASTAPILVALGGGSGRLNKTQYSATLPSGQKGNCGFGGQVWSAGPIRTERGYGGGMYAAGGGGAGRSYTNTTVIFPGQPGGAGGLGNNGGAVGAAAPAGRANTGATGGGGGGGNADGANGGNGAPGGGGGGGGARGVTDTVKGGNGGTGGAGLVYIVVWR